MGAARKKSRSPSRVNTLLEELLIEILSWLPIKPLLRFRCVSKSWLRLLTIDPHFINLHLHRLIKSNTNNSNPNPSILVLRKLQLSNSRFYLAADYRACDGAIEFEPPFNKSLPRHYMVSGICNGLLCLTNFSLEKHSTVYVWNPLTGDHITIQTPPIPSYIPCQSRIIIFGFGFHQGTNEYKVIRMVSSSITCSASEFQSHVSVYTLGTDLWRTIQGISYKICNNNNSNALVNGALHWLASRPGSIFCDLLISFDIKNEVFQQIPQPNDVIYDQLHYVAVGEIGGFLCMISRVLEEEVQVWVMKEYGVVDSWEIHFKVGRPELRGSCHALQPLCVASDGEIIIKKTFWKFVLYNPNTNSIESLKKFGFDAYDAYTFMGSLVSPSLIHGVECITDIVESGRKGSSSSAQESCLSYL